jgi:hypothetical protein
MSQVEEGALEPLIDYVREETSDLIGRQVEATRARKKKKRVGVSAGARGVCASKPLRFIHASQL